MPTNILNTGVSGLVAAQNALAVVSQNISNANTPGYSRQRVDLETRDPQGMGFGYVGTGVTVSSIQRIYDQFNTTQLWTATAGSAQAQQFQALASQVDNLVGDSDTGLSPALQSFFNALQDLSNDPSSQVSRQVVLSQANNLADQFDYFDQQFDQLRGSTNSSLTATVSSINSLAASIADVNRRITDAGTANGQPNDLLDRRDELIRQLSEQVGVTTSTQDNGSVNVFIGNGQALVVGGEARSLTTLPNAYDPQRQEIAYDVQPPVLISDQLTGGKLGGILAFRNQVLDPAQNALGQLAVGLSSTFNQQHELGMDAYGDLGGDFFTPIDQSTSPPAVRVLPAGNNQGQPPAQLGAVISDANALTTSDYRLDRTASGYTLTRLSDNKVFTLSGFPANSATVDGVTLSLTAGSMAVGDSFVVQPTRDGAANFGVAISDPSRIAVAGPLRTSATLGNAGTGQISDAVLLDPAAYSAQAYTLVAVDGDGDGAVDSYNVLDAGNNVIATGAYVSGADITFGGLQVQLSGVPRAGDTFSVAPNVNGTGDNRNALALSALQNQPLLAGGTATYTGLYGRLVADVGNKTSQAQVNSDVQSSLLTQAQQARDAVSGVNLDEEAADVLKYQQAYQAAAQLISTANDLFQTLINVFQR